MARARNFLALPAGIALLLWTSSFFRLDALFNFLEQSIRFLMPLIAFGIGAAAEYLLRQSPTREQRRRIIRVKSLGLLALFLTLFGLHSAFVLYEEHWGRSYVIGWERTPNGCACRPEDSDEECLKTLMAYGESTQQEIYDCWGGDSVRIIEFSLGALYLLFAGLFGSIAGVVILPPRPLRVFVSYRRKDSGNFVHRILAGPLRKALGGESNVFIDKYTIEGGEDWGRKIEAYLKISKAVIVVVGPAWMKELDKERVATDWVKFEIETAIGKEIQLLPVLFGGAKMPERFDRHESLAPLAETQAFEIGEECLVLEKDEGLRIVDKRQLKRDLDKILVAIEKLRILSS